MIKKREGSDPHHCDLEEPQYFEYVLSDDCDPVYKALTFSNTSDPFYGLEFLNRTDLDDFISKLTLAADELWGKDV
ncbi:MAG TPA: hypothetical protein VMW36_06475 [Patescibacteria group bacterium]|nr:hypothetical protein [Patescibacteria group bacterium]